VPAEELEEFNHAGGVDSDTRQPVQLGSGGRVHQRTAIHNRLSGPPVVDVAAWSAFGVHMGWWDEFGSVVVAEADVPAVVVNGTVMMPA
jgi:hypothetical protein